MEKKPPKVAKGKKKLPKNVRERDGKYYYRYSVKNPVTGGRKQKETPGYATASQAEKEGILISAELLKGTYTEKNKLTLSIWCDEWLKWYSASGRHKESTLRQRGTMIELLKSKIGGLSLEEITEDDYQEALNGLFGTKKHSTLVSLHTCAKMIFTRAVQKGKMNKSPTTGAYIPKKTVTIEDREKAKRPPRYLEKKELKPFFAAEESEQMRRVFELLTYTGIRIGELSALLESDFDDLNYLNVSKTRYLSRGVTTYKLTTPKNDSSERTIHLSQKAIKIIKDQLVWKKAFAFSKGKKFYKEKKFLFVCEKKAGYPLHHTIVRNHMIKALEKAGLPDNLTPHSLRHTYTSLMAEAGADLDTIQAQLGHKKGSDVTRLVYMHVTKSREKRDVEMLDVLLDAPD